MNDDELLLKSNDIVFDSNKKVKKKRSLKYELETIYKQKPNTKFIWLTKSNLWWYYQTDSLEDPSKFQKWIKNRIAEPPAIYSDKIAEATANSMKYYLQHKGYYDASVSYEKKVVNKKKKQVAVTYSVLLNNLYTIDSVDFISSDPKIQRILNDSEEDSFLKKGDPVSESVYNKEVDRITSTLKNLGFAYFDRNYVDNLTGDSTDYKVNLKVNILNPRNKTEHTVYHVGKITIVPKYTPSDILAPKQDSIINGVLFQINELGTVVKPESILREVFLKEGELYKDENFIKTKRQLKKLDIYQFISIKTEIDPNDEEKINFKLFLTPKKRMTIGGDVEFNNSNYTGQTTNTSLIGIGLNLNHQNRNFRKNASLLELKASGGIELDVTKFGTGDNAIFSLDILTQADWYIPKFVQFPKIYTGLKKIGFLNDQFYYDLKEKAETKFSVSYNRLLLFDFYNYHSFNMSYGYDFQRNNSNRWLWNQTGVNYLLPRFESGFDSILINNQFIRNSFTKQLFTGAFFKDIKFIHSGKPNLFGSSWKFFGDFETSGLEIYGANKLLSKNTEFMLFDSVEFAQYVRLNLDIRRYLSINKNQMFAYKISVGIARPFGFSEEVPYVKQFYGGGPLGNRAWRIRELGPGGYPPENRDRNQIFYQTGDFKIDMNFEYRFNIFWGLKGAFFVDAGNVWTIDFDEERAGSQLRWKADPEVPNTANFLKQIGIGTGFGLRYDFSYFILGMDVGAKFKNAYRDPKIGYLEARDWDKYQLRDLTYNLMIGYPF